jgi:hypothetical protein
LQGRVKDTALVLLPFVFRRDSVNLYGSDGHPSAETALHQHSSAPGDLDNFSTKGALSRLTSYFQRVLSPIPLLGQEPKLGPAGAIGLSRPIHCIA